MANVFTNLPAPAADGSGAPVDVSGLGATKTVVVGWASSTVSPPYVTIEISNDPLGSEFETLDQFNQAGARTYDVACYWMRATVSNYQGGGAPSVQFGSDDTAPSFTELVAPAGNGAGAAVDTSALPIFKTVQVGGSFDGAVIIEASTDGGTTYAQILSFSASSPRVRSVSVLANRMRVRKVGWTSGTPTVFIGASTLGAGGGGGGTVTTDSTLVGDGSGGDPLGVAPPTVRSSFFNDFIMTNEIVNPSTATRWFADGIEFMSSTADASGINWDNDVTLYPETNVVGLLTLAIGAATSNVSNYGFQLSNYYPWVLGYGVLTMTWRAASSAPAADGNLIFGLGPGGTPIMGGDGPGIFWALSPEQYGDSRWRVCVDEWFVVGSSVVDTGVAVQPNVLQTFTAVHDPSAGTVTCSIDGVVVHTFSGAPVANLVDRPVKLGGELAATLLASNWEARFDYVQVDYEFTTPRT